MNSLHPEPAVVITRVAEHQWHALSDDRVVGRGEASPRPDGRLFLSIDTWHDAEFARLASAMLPALPRPLYTVVDEADEGLKSQWERAGFTTRRREWEYVVPTSRGTVPSDVTIAPATDQELLRSLDDVVRAEVSASVGWSSMPAEVLPRPAGAWDLAKYVVASEPGAYVGMVRLGPVRRQTRIGLIAVRADRRRRGIGRALLTYVLDSLCCKGIESVSFEVDERNPAAIALADGVGARRVGSTVELVVR
ncbi:ribosomal protein S18 acetylase RimI-like enzyme [Amycolatopsis lexingtonensis]|uniref:Ribosomal protein S18 acetylase RimI-like enzyme n=1 Tax=Amycolatopsis lexingtonensis TaxID=218822 RepID=A0ABR9IFJ6_9PSEU|nr:GNAT family N-acetyltransferase [Amycolatopsis lexingtonensis]MBE1501959.1 ribosomal protein S18 acetylase RimI-like enzyme [Amycolatopsis lexingtonensis]